MAPNFTTCTFSRSIAWVSVFASLLMGCGGNEKIELSAIGKLRLSNLTNNGSLYELDNPDRLEVKLLYVYLQEEITGGTLANGWVGENSGATTYLYVHPQCQSDPNELSEDEETAGLIGPRIANADVEGCGSVAGEKSDGVEVEARVTSGIDLALSTSEVNSALASRNRSLLLGKIDEDDEDVEDRNSVPFNFIRVVLGYEGISEENVAWDFENTGVDGEGFEYTLDAITSKFVSPLVLEDGDRIVVELSYDLDGSLTYGADLDLLERDSYANDDDSADSCVGEVGDSDYSCFLMPNFSVSAEAQ